MEQEECALEIRSLKQEELEQWFDHCVYVFNNGEFSASYRQYFANHWYNDPWRDLDGILVAVENEKILSTVRIFFRKIYINGEKVSMGGIGEVSTRPEAQGRGLSTRLLQAAIKKMEDKGIQVSMLAANIQDYYRKFGWETLCMHSKISDLVGSDDSRYAVRPVNPDMDMESIRRIHSHYAKSYNGIIIRDNDEYWEKWFKTEQKSVFVAQDAQGTVVSYICADVGDDRIRIREFGALSGFEDAFSSLASKAAHMLERANCEIHYKGVKNPGMSIKRVAEENYHMIRLITPFEINGEPIETTRKLVSVMEGSRGKGQDSEFVFWDTDGY
ncbi:hypothetical protein CDQ84_06425 [Clostridium thermosuccinogenes]|uniref:N-acetyltransferase domain-containing protein n=1 Tax=Clostridium thermosuccinogenes TaxID=84032 RepID=A0A2K2FHW1_9CLOT|nr:hypothetical protein CDO33_04830 [Pseudoclostridium thermosuccinogenes]PNT98351.1 hypothetical protein CDQ85_05930 [Pseudoclostridium thermosuccinogenes]PNU00452.1 hypothetical protein CDQ84_06425 [Pseudoclostridium thermosuccinogenes]